jgi:hypothetical protein
MFVYIYIHTYIYMWIYMFLFMNIFTYTHMNIYICVYLYRSRIRIESLLSWILAAISASLKTLNPTRHSRSRNSWFWVSPHLALVFLYSVALFCDGGHFRSFKWKNKWKSVYNRINLASKCENINEKHHRP